MKNFLLFSNKFRWQFDATMLKNIKYQLWTMNNGGFGIVDGVSWGVAGDDDFLHSLSV